MSPTFLPSGHSEAAAAAAVIGHHRAISKLTSPGSANGMLPKSAPGFYGYPAHTLLFRLKDLERKAL